MGWWRLSAQVHGARRAGRPISLRCASFEFRKGACSPRDTGPTTDGALLTGIGAGHDFRNGRQAASWTGLAPG